MIYYHSSYKSSAISVIPRPFQHSGPLIPYAFDVSILLNEESVVITIHKLCPVPNSCPMLCLNYDSCAAALFSYDVAALN